MRSSLLWRVAGVAAVMLAYVAPSQAKECMPGITQAEMRLSNALNSRDPLVIAQTLHAINPSNRAPEPDVPDRFSRPDKAAYTLRFGADHLEKAVARYLDAIENSSWWLTSPTPRPPEIPAALRTPAEMIRGLVATAEAYPLHRDRALALASSAADYIVGASDEAGVAYAPFPYWRNAPGRLGLLSERMARRLEACGRLEESIRNGWFVVDLAPEEYFYDTGLVGEALAELQAVAPKRSYARWISNASDWLAKQPMSANFNYNAFPALFHARAYRVLNDPNAIDLALDRIGFGVLPGMLVSGPDSGHWIDPHNDRLTYRVIMIRAMTSTRLALSHAPENRRHAIAAEKLTSAIVMALAAAEEDMKKAGGVTAQGKMVEIYESLEKLKARGVAISIDNQVRDAIYASARQALWLNRLQPDASTGVFLDYLARFE